MDDGLDELSGLLDIYQTQLTAWFATAGANGDLDAASAEFDALELTTMRILALPCDTTDIARRKVEAILRFNGLYTAVREGSDGDRDSMRIFLASLFP